MSIFGPRAFAENWSVIETYAVLAPCCHEKQDLTRSVQGPYMGLFALYADHRLQDAAFFIFEPSSVFFSQRFAAMRASRPADCQAKEAGDFDNEEHKRRRNGPYKQTRQRSDHLQIGQVKRKTEMIHCPPPPAGSRAFSSVFRFSITQTSDSVEAPLRPVKATNRPFGLNCR